MSHSWFITMLAVFATLTDRSVVACANEPLFETFRIVSNHDGSSTGYRNHGVSPGDEYSNSLTILPTDSTAASGSEVFGISAGTAADSVCSEESWAESESSGPGCEIPLIRFRKSFFQGTQFSYGSVGDDPDFGIHIRTLDANATFAIPVGSSENIVSFTPYIRADLLEAAAVFDVPESLFETGVKAFWKHPINDRLGTLLLLAPSVRSDFTTSEGAFRIFGMGLLTWQWIPQELSISGGVVYTGREDFPLLPGMGLLWTPAPEWRFDIQFPSPRISYRFRKNGGVSETWGYLAGVFGGNTWAVTRAGGVVDELTMRDLRLVSGVEYLQAGNRGFFLEVGYVFNRSMEYASVPIERDLDAAIMMRAGITF